MNKSLRWQNELKLGENLVNGQGFHYQSTIIIFEMYSLMRTVSFLDVFFFLIHKIQIFSMMCVLLLIYNEDDEKSILFNKAVDNT